ncbi:LGFP repeat-containing protein [Rhodococcus jostii]|uniref:LGFP repeat-containing protein n=1 Tax=Rhodococcus jostii TaxID=132919 RepID=UPI003658ECCF
MCGLILDKYRAMGGPSGSLGYPTTNENVLPDQVGRSSVFERGSIFWSPSSDAHSIWGRIGDKWGQKGWEGGFLHYPTSDELRNPDGRGLHQTFQGGSIYWSPETDAHSIGGLIRDKWAEKGWERGTLGYPTTDETGVTGGAFNHFQGGSVYWSQSTGAHSIWGAIRDTWFTAGAEKSRFGYPTSDEYDYRSGKRQNFQVNVIDWNVTPDEHDVIDRVTKSANPMATLNALNTADAAAYVSGTKADSPTWENGPVIPIDLAEARKRGLDTAAIDALGPNADAGKAGCFHAKSTLHWTSRFGYKPFDQWIGMDWCHDGSKVGSYKVTERGGKGNLPGFNWIAAGGQGDRSYGWEARAYTQESFGLGFGSVSIQSQQCVQMRAGAGVYSTRATCDLDGQ